MVTLPSKNYWKAFADEKGEQKGKLGESTECRGTIDTLIEVVSVHVFKYDLTSNNCKHFAEQIWDEMVMPKREHVDL